MHCLVQASSDKEIQVADLAFLALQEAHNSAIEQQEPEAFVTQLTTAMQGASLPKGVVERLQRKFSLVLPITTVDTARQSTMPTASATAHAAPATDSLRTRMSASPTPRAAAALRAEPHVTKTGVPVPVPVSKPIFTTISRSTSVMLSSVDAAGTPVTRESPSGSRTGGFSPRALSPIPDGTSANRVLSASGITHTSTPISQSIVRYAQSEDVGTGSNNISATPFASTRRRGQMRVTPPSSLSSTTTPSPLGSSHTSQRGVPSVQAHKPVSDFTYTGAINRSRETSVTAQVSPVCPPPMLRLMSYGYEQPATRSPHSTRHESVRSINTSSIVGGRHIAGDGTPQPVVSARPTMVPRATSAQQNQVTHARRPTVGASSVALSEASQAVRSLRPEANSRDANAGLTKLGQVSQVTLANQINQLSQSTPPTQWRHPTRTPSPVLRHPSVNSSQTGHVGQGETGRRLSVKKPTVSEFGRVRHPVVQGKVVPVSQLPISLNDLSEDREESAVRGRGLNGETTRGQANGVHSEESSLRSDDREDDNDVEGIECDDGEEAVKGIEVSERSEPRKAEIKMTAGEAGEPSGAGEPSEAGEKGASHGEDENENGESDEEGEDNDEEAEESEEEDDDDDSDKEGLVRQASRLSYVHRNQSGERRSCATQQHLMLTPQKRRQGPPTRDNLPPLAPGASPPPERVVSSRSQAPPAPRPPSQTAPATSTAVPPTTAATPATSLTCPSPASVAPPSPKAAQSPTTPSPDSLVSTSASSPHSPGGEGSLSIPAHLTAKLGFLKMREHSATSTPRAPTKQRVILSSNTPETPTTPTSSTATLSPTSLLTRAEPPPATSTPRHSSHPSRLSHLSRIPLRLGCCQGPLAHLSCLVMFQYRRLVSPLC
eukprot:GHVN01083358.1.p1 GENE.GHVN01083358.1~~GHVN01083358.1.p1  ORF type:complete len:1002 (-),score=207.73 GHVN01083358.1:277-2940(-)